MGRRNSSGCGLRVASSNRLIAEKKKTLKSSAKHTQKQVNSRVSHLRRLVVVLLLLRLRVLLLLLFELSLILFLLLFELFLIFGLGLLLRLVGGFLLAHSSVLFGVSSLRLLLLLFLSVRLVRGHLRPNDSTNNQASTSCHKHSELKMGKDDEEMKEKKRKKKKKTLPLSDPSLHSSHPPNL